MISKGAAIGTALSVIGASVGFALEWGPIYWGLIGAVGGFILGLLIDLYMNKVTLKRLRRSQGEISEVILIVECEDTLADVVENTLRHYLALGLARVKNSSEKESINS